MTFASLHILVVEDDCFQADKLVAVICASAHLEHSAAPQAAAPLPKPIQTDPLLHDLHYQHQHKGAPIAHPPGTFNLTLILSFRRSPTKSLRQIRLVVVQCWQPNIEQRSRTLSNIHEDVSPGQKLVQSADVLQKQNEEVVDSAEQLEKQTIKQTDSADRRTELAANRTVLAAERTYAAWVRTGLAALASGVGAQALLEDVLQPGLTKFAGSALVLFSAFCFLAAVWREFRPGAMPPRPDVKRMPPVLLLGLNGFLAFVSLAALVGIWTAKG